MYHHYGRGWSDTDTISQEYSRHADGPSNSRSHRSDSLASDNFDLFADSSDDGDDGACFSDGARRGNRWSTGRSVVRIDETQDVSINLLTPRVLYSY